MQIHTIELPNQVVAYKIRRSQRAKRMRLAVYPNGELIVTLPKGLTRSRARKYLMTKSRWILSKLNYYKEIAIDNSLKLDPKDYLKYKDTVHGLVSERVEFFNQIYGFRYNSIKIKNQKTRWGSCSTKKNLNFNFRIGFLPDNLRDYIIVHELCHLKEMNHSRRFWRLIEKSFHGYRALNKEVKVNGFRYF